jgi:hypothetical protein
MDNDNNKIYRVVACEKHKNKHHYIAKITLEEAKQLIFDGQARFDEAWIEKIEDGRWVKYIG